MMQLTEEQKAALIKQAEHMLTLTAPNGLSTQLFKIALASLTAEPDLYRDSQGCFVTKRKGEKLIKAGELFKPLYTTPPAPALRLPDSISLSGDMDEVYVAAWNDCISEVKRLNATAPQPVTECWTHNLDADAALVMLDRIDTLDPADDGRIEDVKRIIRKMAAAPKPSTN